MKIPHLSIQANFRQICSWLWRTSQGVRLRVLFVCILGLVKVALSLIFVWLSKLLIDAAINASTPLRQIWIYAILLIATMITEMAVWQSYKYIQNLSHNRLINQIRHRIYNVLLQRDIYSQRNHSGDILNRIVVDVDTAVQIITFTVPSAVMMVVQFAAAFLLLCAMNYLLAICALIITPLFILVSRVYFKKMRKLNAEIRTLESNVHTHMQEGVQHRVVVQTLECEKEMTSRFSSVQSALYDLIVHKQRISAFSSTAMRLGFLSGYLIAFIWSIFQLHAGLITYGIMTAFLQLVGRIQHPISGMAELVPSLIRTVTAIDRLIELEGDEQVEEHESIALEGSLGVRLKNVSFGYSEAYNVYTDYNCDFRPGSKTLIKGETGVGKSTLTKLILALVKPDKGEVEIYNARQSVQASSATRCNFVYVPQGNSLLNGTVRTNLLLAKPDATEQQMREVLEIAVAEFVYSLPDALDTHVGELGAYLSEGQCQRIAIARALLREGNVLIFDEFNSSLDQTTASLLYDRLIKSRPDSTMIFISHRDEIAQLCDNVLVIRAN